MSNETERLFSEIINKITEIQKLEEGLKKEVSRFSDYVIAGRYDLSMVRELGKFVQKSFTPDEFKTISKIACFINRYIPEKQRRVFQRLLEKENPVAFNLLTIHGLLYFSYTTKEWLSPYRIS